MWAAMLKEAGCPWAVVEDTNMADQHGGHLGSRKEVWGASWGYGHPVRGLREPRCIFITCFCA